MNHDRKQLGPWVERTAPFVFVVLTIVFDVRELCMGEARRR